MTAQHGAPEGQAPGAQPRTPERIEAEIEAQRAQLAGTVDQLAAMLDVKSRAREKVASVKDRPEVVAATGSLVAMAVVLLLWRRRSH